MSAWQSSLEDTLSATDAPPVLSRDLLDRFARTANADKPVPKSTLSYWLKPMIERGKLKPVHRGLYLNRLRYRPGTPADAVQWLRRDAVVSLNTVLGDAGVLNNPVRTVTAVVPIDNDAPPPSLGRKTTEAGVYHFFGLPRRILDAGSDNDRLEPPERYEHPRATPEKALVDWLYLGLSPRSGRTLPPRYDVDAELLRLPRLRRLAADAGLETALESWLASENELRKKRAAQS